MAGNLKLTQREVSEKKKTRGKPKQIYIKPDIEAKANAYCEKENISLSLMIRLAIEQFLERQG